MSDHDTPYFWEYYVPENRDECKSDEKCHIQAENDNGDPV
jgi:hypothetical protein